MTQPFLPLQWLASLVRCTRRSRSASDWKPLTAIIRFSSPVAPRTPWLPELGEKRELLPDDTREAVLILDDEDVEARWAAAGGGKQRIEVRAMASGTGDVIDRPRWSLSTVQPFCVANARVSSSWRVREVSCWSVERRAWTAARSGVTGCRPGWRQRGRGGP